MSTDIRFPILTTERYLDAVERAKKSIRERIEPPKIEHFKVDHGSAYPQWFTVSVIVALTLVLLFSFVISAGKQVAAMGLVLDDLPVNHNRLSGLWVNVSIIFMLLMSEIGAVLFLVAAGTLAERVQKSAFFRWTINWPQQVFRLFAMLCAGYALISNVTITLINPVNSVAAVLQWFMSIGIPLTVLGLGIMLERIVIDSLKSNAEQTARFNLAMADYRAVIDDPTRHEYYKQALADNIFQEMNRYKPDRLKLLTAFPDIETNQEVKLWLVTSEYRAHKRMEQFDMEVAVSPFLEQATD